MSPRKQPRLTPHHDSSSQTIQKCLHMPEIVHLIASQFSSEDLVLEEDWLRAAALVNSTWAHTLRPLLYSYIYLGPSASTKNHPDERLARLLDVLVERDCARFANTLILRFTKDPNGRRATTGFIGPSADKAAQILALTKNLTTLNLEHVEPQDFVQELLPALLDLHRVRKLVVTCRASSWRSEGQTQEHPIAEHLAPLLQQWPDLRTLHLGDLCSRTSVANSFAVFDAQSTRFAHLKRLVFQNFSLNDSELASIFSTLPALEDLAYARPKEAACTRAGLVEAVRLVAPTLKKLQIQASTGFSIDLLAAVPFPRLQTFSVIEVYLDRGAVVESLPPTVESLSMFLLVPTGSMRRASHFADALKRRLDRRSSALTYLRVPKWTLPFKSKNETLVKVCNKYDIQLDWE